MGPDAALAAVQRIDTTGNRTSTALVTLSDELTYAAAKLGTVRAAVLAAVDPARAAGWSTAPDECGPSKITRSYTPDGCATIAQLSSVGGLSLTGSSPCFPATTTPQPTAIAHPAG